MRPFVELRVWQLAHAFVLDVYRATASFPSEERFGVTAQLRRSAAAVPANIAEGCRAWHARDFARIVNVAEKEASETAYHLLLARDLGYLRADVAATLLATLDRIAGMLNRLRQRISEQARAARPRQPPAPQK